MKGQRGTGRGGQDVRSCPGAYGRREGFHGEQLGTSLMVSPGTLSEGEYALVDLSEREVEEKKL